MADETAKSGPSLAEINTSFAATQARLDAMNEAIARGVKEVRDTLLKAYDDGKSFEGVTFEVHFLEVEPVAEPDPAPAPAPKKRAK